MKKFTTSAQKTLSLSTDVILEKLEKAMLSDNSELTFEKVKPNIKKARTKDGSTIVIAGFIKENGKTLAMIDHEDLPTSVERGEAQALLRKKLDSTFEN